MSQPDAYEQLVTHLDDLTERLAETEDTKERAAIALLIAQARKELEQAREVRGNVETPWWKSQLLYGVAIAAFGIAAYFLEYVEPLLSKQVALAELNNEVQKVRNERQAVRNARQQAANDQQAEENARVEAQNAELLEALEGERLKTIAANENLERVLSRVADQERAQVAALEQKRDDPSANSAKVDEQIALLEQELKETRRAMDDAAERNDRLGQYTIHFDTIDLENCEGIAGETTARFITIEDEPLIFVNGEQAWPDTWKSLECGKVHDVKTTHPLKQAGNRIQLFEYDSDTEKAAMGHFETGALRRDAPCAEVASAPSNRTTYAGGWCTTTFRERDGVYRLVWKITSH